MNHKKSPQELESDPLSHSGWTLNLMILVAPLISAYLHLNCISNLSTWSIWTMYYVDMDNILCSNCNFQETNRKKHRKIIKNKMTTNLKSIFMSNSGIFVQF